MFRNYWALAVRNITRHKLHTFINITGLAVGLTCAILILLFVRDELSYDQWIAGSENLWRVEVTYHVPGRSDPIALTHTPLPLPLAMHDQLPEVRSVTRLSLEGMTLTSGDRQFPQKVGAVDPNFLQVIKLPLVEGDPRTVLLRPENLVISQSIARKYFGDADPMGKTLTTGRGGCKNGDAACASQTVTLRVAGVMRDLPNNTQFDFDCLMPNSSLANRVAAGDAKNWLSTNNSFGYVTLAPGTDPAQILPRFKATLDRNVDISPFTNIKLPGSQIVEVRLTPFLKVHMTSDNYEGAMKPPGSWTLIYGLSTIGALILLVACFNFMNLATATATLRAREISLRKCLGARRRQLVAQFLGEAVLMALLALVLAFALVELLLPSYSRFMGRPLSFHYLSEWPLTLGIVSIGISAGLLSGFYPALILSGFRPGASLRATSSSRSGAGKVRTALVVLQFAISIGLGIGALVVFRQIDFARHIDLGFNRDNIVLMGIGQVAPQSVDSLQQALEKGPGVLSVARTNFVPFTGDTDVLPVQRPGDPQFLSPTHIAVSPNYFSLYGIKILAGRALSDNQTDDVFYDLVEKDYVAKDEGHNVMVNAKLARALGYAPADIVGKTFIFGKSHMRVVGVAADTLVNGVRSPIMQTVYVYAPHRFQGLLIRIQAERTQDTVDYIARASRPFIHGVAQPLNFLGDRYESFYQTEKRQGEIFGIFVTIAIVVACLGLFGLAAIVAGRRTKEIGIRKVFGARDREVVLLLLWQFSIPVLAANLIAWPVAWYYLKGWLSGFAYRIDLNPLYFIAVGLMALLIAWVTILGHALHVARSNPIHALRYE